MFAHRTFELKLPQELDSLMDISFLLSRNRLSSSGRRGEGLGNAVVVNQMLVPLRLTPKVELNGLNM